MREPGFNEMADYLEAGGWLQNRRGWWHPPDCVAAWPTGEAYEMAKRDEAKGLRMTPKQVEQYIEDVRSRE